MNYTFYCYLIYNIPSLSPCVKSPAKPVTCDPGLFLSACFLPCCLVPGGDQWLLQNKAYFYLRGRRADRASTHRSPQCPQLQARSQVCSLCFQGGRREPQNVSIGGCLSHEQSQGSNSGTVMMCQAEFLRHTGCAHGWAKEEVSEGTQSTFPWGRAFVFLLWVFNLISDTTGWEQREHFIGERAERSVLSHPKL